MNPLNSPRLRAFWAPSAVHAKSIRNVYANGHSASPASCKSLFLLLLLTLAVTAFASAPPDGWVATWQGSPTPGGTFYSPGCPSDVGLTGQTVRNLVHISTGGD